MFDHLIEWVLLCPAWGWELLECVAQRLVL
jgi:hypothetical protein